LTPPQIPYRRFTPVLMAVAVAALLAACGSSASTTTTTSASGGSTTASGSTASRTSLRSCLKAHGVTLPSRRAGGGGAPPGGGGFFGGGGGAGSGGRGSFRNNPKLAAAFKACGGGNFRFRRGGNFRISHTAINNYVKCVRQHGYPQMPSPNFSGKGPVFPASIRGNAKFQTASRDCASVLVPLRPGGATATTTSSQT
jgi:hypothetical protein